MKFASMALYDEPALEATPTAPRSVQLPASRVVDVATPIEDT